QRCTRTIVCALLPSPSDDPFLLPARILPMHDILLVINAGSSSLKFQLYAIQEGDTLALMYGGQVSGIGSAHPNFKVRDADRSVLVDRDLPSTPAAEPGAAQHTLAQSLGSRIDRQPVAVGHRIVHGGPRMSDSVLVNDS